MRDRKGHIIGVVKDFHFKSLHQAIEPMVLLPAERGEFGTSSLSVKIRSENIASTVAFLQETWRSQVPGWTFEYSFLDQEFNRAYRAEKQLKQIGGYFTLLTIFIACLGLFGLASFITALRTKEVGIRKVLGASVPQIILLLSKEFALWVLLAMLIAWPLTYFVMDRWLQNFAYRTDIGPGGFLLAGGSAMIIALITVSYHALKAALANPVNALQYE